MPDERPVKLEIRPEEVVGRYANCTQVAASDYEVTVTFAQAAFDLGGDFVPAAVVERMHLSPAAARELALELQEALRHLDARAGAVPLR